ncbi:class I SAM-dependent methyltransferase [Halovivax gelatinilyticus]|uniref:class I SAM-dependent methyltransferase n=1 Tax=Halovivax gelatinilyticus TaxID=2961597 RepID=UPI0020CA50D3|nr:class I SAM-dependent methyltransferase family protein [Halovivax gelatinilyticus]
MSKNTDSDADIDPSESTGENPLAAVVPKARTEIAIESLRAEGIYDDRRAVRSFDDERTALPVTEPPAETRIDRVVRQVEPTFRPTNLDAMLAERGWSEAERARAPGSWAVIGSVVLVTIPSDCPDEGAVAEALLELHGDAETVLADEGIGGPFREPRTRHLAGERETETVHVEHGTAYGLDPAAVMFSPGNQAERVRMGRVVSGSANADLDPVSDSGEVSATADSAGEGGLDAAERVFDMFAGIGYFTLPMARAGAHVTATEANPTAFRYLLENAVRNDVTDRIAAYNADCRDVARTVDADRVVMGYYGIDADEGRDVESQHAEWREQTAATYLPAALEAVVPGGTVHYHEAVHEDALWEGPLDRLDRAIEDAGKTFTVDARRRVKTHSAGVVHVVVDARIE